VKAARSSYVLSKFLGIIILRINMKRTLIAVAAMLVVAPVIATADTTFTYPKDKPVLQITFPEGWKAEADDADDKGLVITSPDDAIEFDLWALEQHSDPKKMIEEIQASADEIGENINEYVTDFKVSEKRSGDINGLKASMFGGMGKSVEDGKPVNVEVTFLTPDDKQLFGMMYWGSEEAEKKHEDALKKIGQSLKKPS